MTEEAQPSTSKRAQAVPDPVKALSAYLPALQAPLVSITRSASSLPGPSDLSFHRSIDKDVAAMLDGQAQQVQEMVKTLTYWAQGKGKGKGKATAAEGDEDDDDDDQVAFYNRIADVVDGLLERADICMDEFSGKAVPRSIENSTEATRLTAPARTIASPAVVSKTGKLPSELTNAQIDPPQRKFTLRPDNSAESQWDRPLTMGKPNAVVPIDWKHPDSSDEFQPGTVRQGMYCAEGDPRHNPYFHEITNAQPPPYVYQPPSSEELQAPPPLDEAVPAGVSGVPFVWIDNRDGIQQLSRHLQEDRVKEIAIDLEAHAYRSYQGIACLMQLSTRWTDYIIDLLSDDVRQSIEILNRSFTDPAKVKILHGAEHDVLWLQRDCGLYLVNLFDTYHATNVLPFPAHGLAYLLTKYYDFEADKRYQLADWRIRPLPKEMLYYARSDTHALIYIYHRLRSELLTAGGKVAMDEVFKRSQVTAARRYAKEVWDEEGNTREGWRSMWKRMGGDEARGVDLRPLPAQMNRTERLLRRLHQWRDRVAREEDESPRYILSASNLINLASRAPMTRTEALAVFSPGIPPVRKRAGEVARIVKEEVLAWEQDQKERQERERANLVESGARDEEDLGTAASVTKGGAPAVTQPTAPSAATAATATASSPVVSSLWSTSNASPSTSIRRSQQSSLLGQMIHSARRSTTTSNGSIDKLHKSLLHSLQSIVGFGGRPDEGKEPIEARESVDEESPMALDDAHSGAQATTADGSQAASASSGSPSPARQEEAEDIVSVKKKTKTKWSREQKRKAREVRGSGNGADNDDDSAASPAPSTKKSRKEQAPATIEPFDYTAQPSILDNPMAALAKKTKGKDTNSKKKGKRDRDKDRMAANDPARFADRPAPRDRSDIKAGARSRTFK